MSHRTQTSLAGRLRWVAFGLWLAGAALAQPVLVVQDPDPEAAYASHVHTSLALRALRRGGLEGELVPADQLAARPVTGSSVALLPYNPNLSVDAAEWLRQFVMAGGRLVAFPPVSPQIAHFVGVGELGAPADATDRRLTRMVLDPGKLPALPDTWHQLDWTYQLATPLTGATVLARWASPEAELAGQPAVIRSRFGLFVGGSLEGDDRATEAQLLLAVVTDACPTLWHTALPRMLASVGQVGDVDGLTPLKNAIVGASIPAPRRTRAIEALSRGYAALQSAKQLYTEGLKQAGAAAPTAATPAQRYLPVARLAWKAQEATEQAYYLAQPARPDEFRGVWLQQAGDLKEWGWERIVAALRENHVDALFFNVVNGGYANYPSSLLPHVTTEGDDPLREVVRACRALGVQCHVWMMVNYIRPLTPPDYLEALRADGRLQQDASGKTRPWLRPADPRNVQRVAAVAREIVSRYDVDGLHLDYLRYDHDADYSPEERRAFEAATDLPVDNWPNDVQLGQSRRTQWVEWRQTNINRELEAIAEGVRAANPKVKLSAAVYPIWTDAKFLVGQDPETWAHHGWVDFLCPMNYNTNDTTFYRYLTLQQRAVGAKVPLYPGIAAFRQESPADTISQIRQLRALDMPGYVLFHYDRRLAREWLPALRAGIASLPGLSPLTPSLAATR